MLLAPAGVIYGQVTAWRMARTGVRLPVPVVCVGNFVAGGSGKTPTALAIARWLADRGWTPGFVSRGYGGRLPGPVTVDPMQHGFEDVGDEPLLLARVAMTTVARDRVAAARHAVVNGADILIMDDGLQNPSLMKDLRFAVVDAGLGSGNGLCVPAGPLRAPLEAQWPHVDAVVIIGEGRGGEGMAMAAQRAGKQAVRAALTPAPGLAGALQGSPVVAFAGIGRPEKFFETVAALGASLADSRGFTDHHPYSSTDMDMLIRLARAHEARLVTTEKDWVRIPQTHRAEIISVPVALTFKGDAIDALLAEFRRGPPKPTGQA
jgi:tetraacyldisaccharide 4'-kinase